MSSFMDDLFFLYTINERPGCTCKEIITLLPPIINDLTTMIFKYLQQTYITNFSYSLTFYCNIERNT